MMTGNRAVDAYYCRMMEENMLYNRVIFVVRVYGGSKLGSARFTCYRDAALAVISGEANTSASSLDTKLTEVAEKALDARPQRTPAATASKPAESTPLPQRHRFNHNQASYQETGSPSHYEPKAVSQQQQHLNSIRGAYSRGHHNPRGYRGGRNSANSRPYRGARGNKYQPRGRPVGANQRHSTDRYHEHIQSQEHRSFNFANPIEKYRPQIRDWSQD